MNSYYAEKLSGLRLKRCYEVSSPRIRQYLEAEIRHVLDSLQPGDTVLELGCGYGRATFRLVEVARFAVGIDNALDNLNLARELANPGSRCEFLGMDALHLGFTDGVFDAVICIQNGICAFRIDQEALLKEALRVTRSGGRVLLSTYSDRFWQDRLEWFEAQAAEGLVGPIDHDASGNGVIACKDGFRSGRASPVGFRVLCSGLGYNPDIKEVDGSSVFCRICKAE